MAAFDHDSFRNALVLTGPTGSGKTQLGLTLAERLGAEIICMDSMTLYRGMDIGTAKPSAEERRRIPHHLIDVLDPWENGSVAWWLEQAADCCRAIEARGRRVLFVGGTPLYLKAMLHGLFDGPPAEPGLRSRLIREAQESGSAPLHRRLATLDPIAAQRLHPSDLRRVVRALEVWELTGQPISHWQQQWQPGNASKSDHLEEARVFYLDRPRSELYARINARVVAMVENGWLEEARRLRELSQPLSRTARQALGYQEWFAYFDGQMTLEQTVERIQTRNRHFAKRQLTWFRQLPECVPLTRELTFGRWGLRMD
jgi:tRNA dimethylallyltransferase